MPQACLQKNYGSSFSGSAKAGRGHNKVVTFGGVTEIQQPIDTSLSSEGEETELLRRLLSKATVAMPTIDLVSQRSERERRYELGQIRENVGSSGSNAVSCICLDCVKNEHSHFCSDCSFSSRNTYSICVQHVMQ